MVYNNNNNNKKCNFSFCCYFCRIIKVLNVLLLYNKDYLVLLLQYSTSIFIYLAISTRDGLLIDTNA